jgi:hypothetical protein
MNENQKEPKDLEGEDLIQWLKSRPPLFTESVEFEGMSLSIVDPEQAEKEVPKEEMPGTPEQTRASA